MEDVRKTLAAQAGLLTELLTQVADPVLRKRQVSFATFELLSAVKAAGRTATQAEIAQRLGITPPTLTEAIKTAVARGLLTQGRNQHDQRTKSLHLTELGAQVVREVLDTVNQAERAMVEEIDSDALAIAVETLRQANRSLARSMESRPQ